MAVCDAQPFSFCDPDYEKKQNFFILTQKSVFVKSGFFIFNS